MNHPQPGAPVVPVLKPIARAKLKAEKVHEDLSIAGAEIDLTNAALEQTLPAAQKNGAVRKALDQNASVGERIVDAADELDEVKELLEEEIAERQRLEQQLAQRSAS
jgi:hypothetical protein